MRDILSSIVRPELNHIYTERPRHVRGGSDFGWFCREHAMHLSVLAQLLGHRAGIILGDFELALPDGRILTSVGDDSDHAWCAVDEVLPVDISVSTRYLFPKEPDIGLVFGSHTTDGGYSVTYHVGDTADLAKQTAINRRPAISYFEVKSHVLDPIQCLDQPHDFLFPPPPGCPSFVEIFGEDVFFQITWHCYGLAIGDAKPFFTYRSPEQTVKGIIKFNRDARQTINDKLRK